MFEGQRIGDNGIFKRRPLIVPLSSDNYSQLFLQETPLMDVRAPIEFAKGAFPQARNIPLLDDEQRHVIGSCYADAGQDAAVALGLQLATPEIRSQRLTDWVDYLDANPGAHLYCFRGGLRSRTTQQWLAEQGRDIPLVSGGYKALRRFLIQRLETLSESAPMILLAGATGVGKTLVIQQWPHSLDLEGKSLHRGSAFGGTFVPQPTQISWENAIAIDWHKRRAASSAPILVEAESQLIGRIFVPQFLQDAMARAPVIVLEMPLQARIELLREDYVTHALEHLKVVAPHAPWAALEAHVVDNLRRIRKRLGNERCDGLINAVPDAVSALRTQADWGAFDHIIRVLLQEYYDKLYAHKMTEREARAVFRGDRLAVMQWLAENHS